MGLGTQMYFVEDVVLGMLETKTGAMIWQRAWDRVLVSLDLVVAVRVYVQQSNVR